MYGHMSKLEKSPIIELDMIKTTKVPKVASKSFGP